MEVSEKRAARQPVRGRWFVWFAFLILWSVALLMPNPIDPFNRYVLGGRELSHEITFLMAKSLHVCAYAAAAILTGWLRVPGPRRWWLLAFWSFHAAATEVGQLFVPGRTGSIRDVALDHLGLLIGLAISWRWWRSKPEEKW